MIRLLPYLLIWTTLLAADDLSDECKYALKEKCKTGLVKSGESILPLSKYQAKIIACIEKVPACTPEEKQRLRAGLKTEFQEFYQKAQDELNKENTKYESQAAEMETGSRQMRIKSALLMHYHAVQRLPSRLEDLFENPGGDWNGPYLRRGDLIDAWGTPFRFSPTGAKNYELVSAGPDKIFGTQDDQKSPR